MATLEELVHEVHVLRTDLESLRDSVRANGVLSVFYRRVIIIALILCALSFITAVVATWRIIMLGERVQSIYSTLEDWQLTE